MKKDWKANSKSQYVTLGASDHSNKEREENDFYATSDIAVRLLLDSESFNPFVWECACGTGHISKVLEDYMYTVKSTDIIDRGYGEGCVDFLSCDIKYWHGDIITNPPYSLAHEFVEKALSIVNQGSKVAMFLRLLFLEGQKRRKLFHANPPKRVYVFSKRAYCAKNGDFSIQNEGGAVAYAWFVWEKGYKNDSIIKWIN